MWLGIHESHRATSNKEAVLKWVREHFFCSYPFQAQHRRSRQNAISQFFPGKDLTIYFPSCCLRFWLLNNLHVGAHWDIPSNLKELVDISSAFSPRITAVIKQRLQLLPERSLSTDLPPHHLISILFFLVPHLLRLPFEGLTSKLPSFGNQRGSAFMNPSGTHKIKR